MSDVATYGGGVFDVAMVDVAQNARPTVVGYPMSGVAQDARRTVGGMSDVGTLGRCLMWRKMRGALRPKSNV